MNSLFTSNAAGSNLGSSHAGKLPELKTILPLVFHQKETPETFKLSRADLIQKKQSFRAQRETAFSETRGLPALSQEKAALYQEINACTERERLLEEQLQTHFVPQHSPEQFLSPRAFFVTPLFNARNKSVARNTEVNVPLMTTPTGGVIRYSGPELRQSDGRVFLALLNMLRDVQVGTAVSFQPDELCRVLLGRYDGNSRNLLRTHIQRLQKGLVLTSTFSVQLCLKFDYPKRGGWTVSLDRQIVELFRASPAAWFPLKSRLGLPDGLASWLYAYVESQTRLIPMKVARLRELCGSDADERAFTNSLRLALKHVCETGAIHLLWSVKNREVRWLKCSSGTCQ